MVDQLPLAPSRVEAAYLAFRNQSCKFKLQAPLATNKSLLSQCSPVRVYEDIERGPSF